MTECGFFSSIFLLSTHAGGPHATAHFLYTLIIAEATNRMTRGEFCIWALRSFSWGHDFRYMSMTGTQQAGEENGGKGDKTDGNKSKDMQDGLSLLLVSRGKTNNRTGIHSGHKHVWLSLFIFPPLLIFSLFFLFFYFYVREKSRDAALEGAGETRPPMRSIKTMMNVVYEGTDEFRPRNATTKKRLVYV